MKKMVVCGVCALLFTFTYFIVQEDGVKGKVLHAIADRSTSLANITRHLFSHEGIAENNFATQMKLENLETVERITEMQLSALSKRHGPIHPRHGPIHQPRKSGIASKTSSKSKDISPSSLKGVRTDYRFRRPMAKTLKKLTPSDIEIEKATDPLHASVRCVAPLVFLTVLVMSAPKNFDRRQQIRDTWALSYPEDVKLLKKRTSLAGMEKTLGDRDMFRTVFVVGQSGDAGERKRVEDEGRRNGDVVFGGFRDSYKNLTMKTRLGLKWSVFDCNTAYVLKTDDDVFVNPVVLVEWLKTSRRNNFYTGWCNFGSKPVRNPKSKWFVSPRDFPGNTYPGYCLGGGYLMSNDVAAKVLSRSYGRPLFPMEDLYVGLLVTEMKEIQVRDERKHFDLIYGGRSNDCELNELFLAHRVLGDDLVGHIKRARLALGECSGDNDSSIRDLMFRADSE